MRTLIKRLRRGISLRGARIFEKPKQEAISGILSVKNPVPLLAFSLRYARRYCKPWLKLQRRKNLHPRDLER